ncbi:hypothetical protein HDV05_005874 [Chytridiales sp. JEL 0842]|nr:hypothetical protein HDV05_005874 [Chytridiales sp. JEL 0842]
MARHAKNRKTLQLVLEDPDRLSVSKRVVQLEEHFKRRAASSALTESPDSSTLTGEPGTPSLSSTCQSAPPVVWIRGPLDGTQSPAEGIYAFPTPAPSSAGGRSPADSFPASGIATSRILSVQPSSAYLAVPGAPPPSASMNGNNGWGDSNDNSVNMRPPSVSKIVTLLEEELKRKRELGRASMQSQDGSPTSASLARNNAGGIDSEIASSRTSKAAKTDSTAKPVSPTALAPPPPTAPTFHAPPQAPPSNIKANAAPAPTSQLSYRPKPPSATDAKEPALFTKLNGKWVETPRTMAFFQSAELTDDAEKALKEIEEASSTSNGSAGAVEGTSQKERNVIDLKTLAMGLDKEIKDKGLGDSVLGGAGAVPPSNKFTTTAVNSNLHINTAAKTSSSPASAPKPTTASSTLATTTSIAPPNTAATTSTSHLPLTSATPEKQTTSHQLSPTKTPTTASTSDSKARTLQQLDLLMDFVNDLEKDVGPPTPSPRPSMLVDDEKEKPLKPVADETSATSREEEKGVGGLTRKKSRRNGGAWLVKDGALTDAGGSLEDDELINDSSLDDIRRQNGWGEELDELEAKEKDRQSWLSDVDRRLEDDEDEEMNPLEAVKRFMEKSGSSLMGSMRSLNQRGSLAGSLDRLSMSQSLATGSEKGSIGDLSVSSRTKKPGREITLEKIAKIQGLPYNLFMSQGKLYATNAKDTSILTYFPMDMENILSADADGKVVTLASIIRESKSDSTTKLCRTEIEFDDNSTASQWAMKLFSLACKGNMLQVTEKLAILLVDKSETSKIKDLLQKKMIPIFEASRKPYDVIPVDFDVTKIKEAIADIDLNKVNSIACISTKKILKEVSSTLYASALAFAEGDERRVKVSESPPSDPIDLSLNLVKDPLTAPFFSIFTATIKSGNSLKTILNNKIKKK